MRAKPRLERTTSVIRSLDHGDGARGRGGIARRGGVAQLADEHADVDVTNVGGDPDGYLHDQVGHVDVDQAPLPHRAAVLDRDHGGGVGAGGARGGPVGQLVHQHGHVQIAYVRREGDGYLDGDVSQVDVDEPCRRGRRRRRTSGIWACLCSFAVAFSPTTFHPPEYRNEHAPGGGSATSGGPPVVTEGRWYGRG